MEYRRPRNSSHVTHTRHGSTMPIYSEWTKYPFGLRMLLVGPHGKACIIRQLLPVPPHATSLPGICRRKPRYPHARVSNRHNRRGPSAGTSTSTTGKQPPQPTRIASNATPAHSTLAHTAGATYHSHNRSAVRTSSDTIHTSRGRKHATQPEATIFRLQLSITDHNNKMHHYNLT